MAMIKVLRVLPGQAPQVAEIGTKLEDLQKEVGGYIEFVDLEDGVSAVANEEGLIHGLPFNRVLRGSYGETPVVGNFVVVGIDGAEGDTVGLTDKQIEKWTAKLS